MAPNPPAHAIKHERQQLQQDRQPLGVANPATYNPRPTPRLKPKLKAPSPTSRAAADPAPSCAQYPPSSSATAMSSSHRSAAISYPSTRHRQPSSGKLQRHNGPRYTPPPETDTHKTAALWQAVRQLRLRTMPSPAGYRQQTTASAAKRNTSPANARPRRPPSSRQSSSSRLPASTAATSTSYNNKAKMGTSPKITDKNFRSAILDRYGIHISKKGEVISPFQHFSTQDPDLVEFKGSIAKWYQNTHSDCDVWLSLDREEAENQAKQYLNMQILRENEAKFSHRGKIYFFKEDDMFSTGDPGRCSSTYFKLEWGPTPDDEQLCRPPPINSFASEEEDARLFAFNTNPDCTYWLTLRRLNIMYRKLVETVTHVLPYAKVTAPYLTIEFKKEHTSFAAAENQIAVFAALILFNRVRLRCRRLEACGRKSETWTQDDFADIKHYGIAFSACEASCYIGRPSLSFEALAPGVELQYPWRGCTLSLITICDAVHADGILEIKRWVNEIHNWGLGEHSRNFVLDVKGVLVHGPSGRDRISLLQEEIATLGLETGQPSEVSAQR